MANVTNAKTITKNTLVLYFRMLFLMCISLYTSRVLLEALGVSDYGIYNVVCGFVTTFSLVSSALTSACTRFINFEMGKGQLDRMNTVFSTSVIVHIAIAIIVVILCESFGAWYINNKMVIPCERLFAANCVFQISTINFCLNLITIPYNASIIAHEKMSAFAYVSIFEGIARLLICFVVMYAAFDHLILYAFLFMAVQVIVMIIYQIYCRRNFEECKLRFVLDKNLLQNMFCYSGWHIIGNSAGILNRQGVDIVLNLFYGPLLNAAKGISNQVLNAVSGFANNFMVALNPQITQSYARGDFSTLFGLMFRGARFSFFLIYIISLPIILNIGYIMQLWLKVVPDYAVQLASLSLICAMITAFSNPLVTAQNATGNVRNYQIIIGGLQLLNLPFCFLSLQLGLTPLVVLYIAIIIELCCLIARLIIIPHYIPQFNSRSFIRQVIMPSLRTVLASLPFPLLSKNIAEDSFGGFVVVSFISLSCSAIAIFYVGCNKDERKMIVSFVNNKFKNR